VQDFLLNPFAPVNAATFQSIFGMIMTVLIALEFNHAIMSILHRKDSIVQLRTVILIALLAMARKFIIIDFTGLDPLAVRTAAKPRMRRIRPPVAESFAAVTENLLGRSAKSKDKIPLATHSRRATVRDGCRSLPFGLTNSGEGGGGSLVVRRRGLGSVFCPSRSNFVFFAHHELLLATDFYRLAASLFCGRLFTKGEGGTLGLAQFLSAIDIGLENTKWPIVTIKRAMECPDEIAKFVV
jgi:Phosphate-starvation-inducible E family